MVLSQKDSVKGQFSACSAQSTALVGGHRNKIPDRVETACLHIRLHLFYLINLRNHMLRFNISNWIISVFIL
ncbi:hypothetical protein ATANTOWER_016057 [Ataeniobius toweri]|uniref:Uncharacterized protein n=1 Tax=Ataeniobius toweri TaxID=208326 RepID=A0ABU7ATL6_9TELE|nr:hypothetical protein [Ataeniobius toweri]